MLCHSGIKFHCGVAMAHMSRTGRVYERGKALNEDLGKNIIQDVVEKGGDLVIFLVVFFGNCAEKQDNIQYS